MRYQFFSAAFLFAIISSSCADEVKGNEPVKIEQAEKRLAAGAQLIDVRTKEEWDEGRLMGATLVTVTEDEFLDKAKAALDVEKPVMVYCRSGKRSQIATKQLRAAGFTVYEIQGGINAWIAAGKPVEK